MDARIARLELELIRLNAHLERMETMLRSLEARKTIDSADIACLGAVIVMMVLFGSLWHSMG